MFGPTAEPGEAGSGLVVWRRVNRKRYQVVPEQICVWGRAVAPELAPRADREHGLSVRRATWPFRHKCTGGRENVQLEYLALSSPILPTGVFGDGRPHRPVTRSCMRTLLSSMLPALIKRYL